MNLCKYKEIFGKPKEGAHSYRLFNLAIVDVALTFVLAWVVSYLFGIRYLLAVLLSFLSGIFFHWLFCVNTTIGEALFGTL